MRNARNLISCGRANSGWNFVALALAFPAAGRDSRFVQARPARSFELTHRWRTEAVVNDSLWSSTIVGGDFVFSSSRLSSRRKSAPRLGASWAIDGGSYAITANPRWRGVAESDALWLDLPR